MLPKSIAHLFLSLLGNGGQSKISKPPGPKAHPLGPRDTQVTTLAQASLYPGVQHLEPDKSPYKFATLLANTDGGHCKSLGQHESVEAATDFCVNTAFVLPCLLVPNE